MMEETLQDLIDEASQISRMVDDPETCRMKDCVLNAYCGLSKCGVGHCEAVRIASRLLKLNNPSSTYVAQNIVECWVFKNSQKSVN